MVAVTKFTESTILDAAERVISAAGIDGASMAAIARAANAPNGSIYHRFPTRKHLLGALWVRTAGSYRDTLMAAIEIGDDLAETVVNHTFAWVDENPARAELLMRFRTEDFVAGDWPDDVIRLIQATNEALALAVAAIARHRGLHPLDVTLAIVDIPAACARRSLLLDTPQATRHLRERATQLGRALLAPQPPTGSPSTR